MTTRARWILRGLGILCILYGFGIICCKQQRSGPELVVAKLPKIGTGWIDTLRAVAGEAVIDTLPFGKQVFMYGGQPFVQVGWYNDGENTIYVHPDTAAYRRMRKWCPPARLCHPVELMVPSGVLAHEFGHRFQVCLWPHGPVREAGDSLPTWAQGDPEVFADRFGVALLALRDGRPGVPDDSILNREVRSRMRWHWARHLLWLAFHGKSC